MDGYKMGTDPGSLATASETVGSATRIDVSAELGAAGRQSHGYFRSRKFAISAGIVAPIVCLTLQRVVLAGAELEMPGLSFINDFRILGYGFIALEITVLIVRLGFGARLGTSNAIVAGVLFAGALFAGGLGLVLLPSSVIGLMILIGALGFVPFFAAGAYFANGVVAYRDARREAAGPKLAALVLIGAMVAIAAPGGVQVGISLTLRPAIRAVEEGNPAGMAKLRAFRWFGATDELARAFMRQRDATRRERLADAYQELTGEDIGVRLALAERGLL